MKTLDPDWNCTCFVELPDTFWDDVENSCGDEAYLELEIFDWDRFTFGDPMGVVRVNLKQVLQEHGHGKRVQSTKLVQETPTSGKVSGELTYSLAISNPHPEKRTRGKLFGPEVELMSNIELDPLKPGARVEVLRGRGLVAKDK